MAKTNQRAKTTKVQVSRVPEMRILCFHVPSTAIPAVTSNKPQHDFGNPLGEKRQQDGFATSQLRVLIFSGGKHSLWLLR